MHRGAWYYSAEENLGYCGAIRSAATVLADDPIFGRFCYGGSWQQVSTNLQVIPMDGVRRRFHAMLNNGAVHAIIDTDRFALSQPVTLASDVSALSFTLETGNTAAHTARLHLSALAPGAYTLSDTNGPIATLTLVNGQETIYDLPMPAATPTKTFSISH